MFDFLNCCKGSYEEENEMHINSVNKTKVNNNIIKNKNGISNSSNL